MTSLKVTTNGRLPTRSQCCSDGDHQARHPPVLETEQVEQHRNGAHGSSDSCSPGDSSRDTTSQRAHGEQPPYGFAKRPFARVEIVVRSGPSSDH